MKHERKWCLKVKLSQSKWSHLVPGQLKFTSDTSREFVHPFLLLLLLTGADVDVRIENFQGPKISSFVLLSHFNDPHVQQTVRHKQFR